MATQQLAAIKEMVQPAMNISDTALIVSEHHPDEDTPQEQADENGYVPLPGSKVQWRAQIGRHLRAYIVEFVGVVIFVFIGTLQAVSARHAPTVTVLIAAFAHGITIALLVASMGHISGGHYNPAVSLGAFLGGALSLIDLVVYVFSQMLGGFVGALIARGALTQKIYSAIGAATTAPNASTTWAQGLLVEGFLTFILVNSVLNAAVDTDKNVLAPLAIGFSVFVDILAGAFITGASMNPARSFGPALCGTIFGEDTAKLWNMWYIYYVGPAIGAVVAGLFYRSIFANEKKRFLFKEKVN